MFANVTNDMTIANEEIFGPVVSILGYETVDEAVKIGNDTEYGLAAYISGTDLEKSTRSPRGPFAPARCRSTAAATCTAPFGGYKMSGNGREWGDYGFQNTWRPRPCSASRP